MAAVGLNNVGMSKAFHQLKSICNPEEPESTSNAAVIVLVILIPFLVLALVIGVLFLRARARKAAAESQGEDTTISTMEEGPTEKTEAGGQSGLDSAIAPTSMVASTTDDVDQDKDAGTTESAADQPNYVDLGDQPLPAAAEEGKKEEEDDDDDSQ